MATWIPSRGHYDEARADYDRGIATAEPVNKPFYANYKLFTWVHAGDSATAVRELEKLAGETDLDGTTRRSTDGSQGVRTHERCDGGPAHGMNNEAARVIGELAAVLRANAKAVGTEEFANIQEAQIAYFEGQLAARRGDYAQASKLAKKYSDLVAPQKNPRKMENYHDLMGLISFLQKKYPQAVAEYRQADLTNMYNKYHLAQGTGSREPGCGGAQDLQGSGELEFQYRRLRAGAQAMRSPGPAKASALIASVSGRGATLRGAMPARTPGPADLEPIERASVDELRGLQPAYACSGRSVMPMKM